MSASEQITPYPQMPRIDVHTHLGGDVETIGRCLKIREALQERHGVDLAMWIDLGGSRAPECDLEAVDRASGGRVLCCIHDFSIQRGIRRDPGELAGMIEQDPVRGLGLPAEVLEKIYWRNAARVYPRVWERMVGLGCVEGSGSVGRG